jgi:excisionase family DNA binding protein
MTRPPDDVHDDDDQMFSIGEAAAYLRLPIATMRDWRHRGVGPDSFKVGRHVRYRRSVLRAWLREQSNRPHKPPRRSPRPAH